MKKFFLATVLVGLTVSCLDKTAEDWSQQRVDEELNEYEAVAGRYVGTAQFADNISSEMILELEPWTQLRQDAASSIVLQRPVLRGNLTLITDGQPVRVGFAQGFYDSKKQTLQVSIPLALDSVGAQGPKEILQVDLKAKRISSGEVLQGRVQALDFPSQGATFEIRRSFAPQSIEEPSGNIKGLEVGRWRLNPPTYTLKLFVKRENDETELARMFRPVETVDVALVSEGGHLSLAFLGAEFDRRTGLLKGIMNHNMGGAGSQRGYLSCRALRNDLTAWVAQGRPNLAEIGAWRCHLESSLNESRPWDDQIFTKL